MTQPRDHTADITRDDVASMIDRLEAAITQRQGRPTWLRADELAELRKRYPGPQGGVDWEAVVGASLGNPSDQETTT
ncbi:MAG: hypothetical protein ACOYB3_05535 [Azonexus sp.]